MAEVEYKGIKVGGSKLLLILPLLGALGSSLWGGFEFYKDYISMKKVIQNINITAIKNENVLVQTKLNAALDYTRDIKNDLRDDILKAETYIDKVSDKVEKSEDKIDTKVSNSEDRIKDTQTSIEIVLESMLDKMNELQKDTTSSIREVESLNRETEKDVRDTMRSTEERIDIAMRKLEDRLNERLQEAFDNPLAKN